MAKAKGKIYSISYIIQANFYPTDIHPSPPVTVLWMTFACIGATHACTHLPILETESNLVCVESHVKAILSTPTQDLGREHGHIKNTLHSSRINSF